MTLAQFTLITYAHKYSNGLTEKWTKTGKRGTTGAACLSQDTAHSSYLSACPSTRGARAASIWPCQSPNTLSNAIMLKRAPLLGCSSRDCFSIPGPMHHNT